MSRGPSSSPHTTPDESTVLPVEYTPRPCASGCDTLEQVNPLRLPDFAVLQVALHAQSPILQGLSAAHASSWPRCFDR
jgi:hypothetical protein